MLKGIGASQGYGIGKAVIINDMNTDYDSVRRASGAHWLLLRQSLCRRSARDTA